MEKRFDRIEEKLDEVKDELSTTNVILAKNTESLEYHIKRTDLLESKVSHIDGHVKMMQGASKVVGALLALASLTWVVINIIEFLTK